MRIGIATDHGGFQLKEELAVQLRNAGHEVLDFGAHKLVPGRTHRRTGVGLGPSPGLSRGEIQSGAATRASPGQSGGVGGKARIGRTERSFYGRGQNG